LERLAATGRAVARRAQRRHPSWHGPIQHAFAFAVVFKPDGAGTIGKVRSPIDHQTFDRLQVNSIAFESSGRLIVVASRRRPRRTTISSLLVTIVRGCHCSRQSFRNRRICRPDIMGTGSPIEPMRGDQATTAWGGGGNLVHSFLFFITSSSPPDRSRGRQQRRRRPIPGGGAPWTPDLGKAARLPDLPCLMPDVANRRGRFAENDRRGGESRQPGARGFTARATRGASDAEQ